MSIKVKLYQSGENSPNLVTLVISDGIKWRLNFTTSVISKSRQMSIKVNLYQSSEIRQIWTHWSLVTG